MPHLARTYVILCFREDIGSSITANGNGGGTGLQALNEQGGGPTHQAQKTILRLWLCEFDHSRRNRGTERALHIVDPPRAGRERAWREARQRFPALGGER